MPTPERRDTAGEGGRHVIEVGLVLVGLLCIGGGIVTTVWGLAHNMWAVRSWRTFTVAWALVAVAWVTVAVMALR